MAGHRVVGGGRALARVVLALADAGGRWLGVVGRGRWVVAGRAGAPDGVGGGGRAVGGGCGHRCEWEVGGGVGEAFFFRVCSFESVSRVLLRVLSE